MASLFASGGPWRGTDHPATKKAASERRRPWGMALVSKDQSRVKRTETSARLGGQFLQSIYAKTFREAVTPM
jgi:hypothetical protein